MHKQRAMLRSQCHVVIEMALAKVAGILGKTAFNLRYTLDITVIRLEET